MMRQSGQQRVGFTLIELLVVISIIAVLIGLTLAAVMQVLGIGPRADTTSRITAISNAIGTFKSEKGVTFIPGGSIDDRPTIIVPGNLVPQPNPAYGSVVGPFRLRNIYPQPGAVPNFPITEPDANSFEARYIKRVWPNADIDGSQSPQPYPSNNILLATALGNPSTLNPKFPFPADLDANQTLLFFLNGIADQDPNAPGNFSFRGFSKNPQRPFEPYSTAVTASDRTKPYLDISNKHYLAPINTTFNPNAMSPNVVNPNYPWLVDGWRRPFAYFAAFNGKPAKIPPTPTPMVPVPPTAYDGKNDLFTIAAVQNIQKPMNTPKAYINGTRYELESGFQIVSAGKDGIFGTSGNWNSVTTPDGNDDRANFSTANLGAGPTK